MIRLFKILLAVCTLVTSSLVLAEETPGKQIPFIRKNEIKLVVAAENLAHARDVLKLEGRPSVRQIVCFFDTEDLALNAKHLILRAREENGEAGESTVKIRGVPDGVTVSEMVLAISPEQDWTRADRPAISRGLDSGPLENGLVSKTVESGKDVVRLFDTPQRAWVTARMGDFDWSRLKRYGPVTAEVWKRQLKLDGYKGRVTVEIWHLESGDRSQDILEISTKVKADSEDEARTTAKDFFAAAKAAGLGDPTGDTKTAKVLEFYKPRR